ncbi:Autoinducer 2 sensor kinase/phosphatase LuxQ [Penicillium rolfsii]|nr:Autoinducer 2 sensor kinase/phosphatase LuxQ [Penicillium rolfsii]
MDQPGSLAFHPSTCSTERERIRELSRYYCALDRPLTLSTSTTEEEDGVEWAQDTPQGDEQPSVGNLSTDITLTALAQLGVHRLACNRSFVSIIDGGNQHIIAEATGSISLRDKDKHLPNDGIYLGARSVDLSWGICPHAILLFTGRDTSYAVDNENITANRTRYIIRDLKQEEMFKDRPYVRTWPYMRFYAEVPLYSPGGFVLGSYCVIDDKPRAVFSEEDVNTLREVADAVARHLEHVRIVHCHRRSERLIKGLTNFVKDHADFDPREVSNDHRLEAMAVASNVNTSSSDDSPGPMEAAMNQQFGFVTSSSTSLSEQPSPMFFTGPASGSTEPSSLPSTNSDRRSSPGEDNSIDELLKAGPPPLDEVSNHASQLSLAESTSLGERIERIFQRASVLLRKSMDLDGVVFLDAARTNPSFLPPDDQAGWEPLPKTADPEFPVAPYPSPLGRSPTSSKTSELCCDVLSKSLKVRKGETLDSKADITFREDLLNLLVTTFPQGQIFNLDDSVDSDDYLSYESGLNDSETQKKLMQMATRQLSQILPAANSVLFFPLWDHNKFRWMAGTLVWTQDNHRALGIEELHYFKIFGDSIVSEVSRAHWATTEKSKFDFISSISHELRSPLHGILASAELLQATTLEPAQEEMVKMIETSGLTLLDTTDHLLEFCKINNLTQVKMSRNKKCKSEESSLVSDFHLGHLVEEVADILYTGQNASDIVSQTVQTSSSDRTRTNSFPTENPTDDMSVIVRIEQRNSWLIRSLPGAWRRIVMNLLGNAIKWTKSGFVEVSLSRIRNPIEPRTPIAHLSVTDTGSGIAPDFLRHKLFSPFSQEDSLSEGVGLGLSIVRQLVASFNGHVNVRSEVGVGTQVDVYIPVDLVETPETSPASCPSPLPAPKGSGPPLRACLVAFNGYPDLQETPTGMLSLESKRKLSIQSTLADVFMAHFGWTVSLAESLSKGQGDVVVIEEAVLRKEAEGLESLDQLASLYGFRFFIVLGSNASFFETFLAPNFVWVSQPFGPQKIQSAIQRILDLGPSRLEPAPTTKSPLLVGPLLPHPEAPHSPTRETFPMTMPASPVARRSLASSLALPIRPSQEPQNIHVLVVDDNDINLKILATFMRKIGCSYETASNGLIALEKYKASERRFDFVLMDISMPVMDGLVSTSKIRQHEKENGLEPSCIMAVTGVASDAMQQQALAAGINDYLIKPLSLQELKNIMSIT